MLNRDYGPENVGCTRLSAAPLWESGVDAPKDAIPFTNACPKCGMQRDETCGARSPTAFLLVAYLTAQNLLAVRCQSCSYGWFMHPKDARTQEKEE